MADPSTLADTWASKYPTVLQAACPHCQPHRIAGPEDSQREPEPPPPKLSARQQARALARLRRAMLRQRRQAAKPRKARQNAPQAPIVDAVVQV
jgi:hypothetical protein